MGICRYEDLIVWQAAKRLSDETGRLIQRGELGADFPLRHQLSAATLSTVANIAEGFVRKSGKDFAHFLRIAAASNAEARALFQAASGRGYLDAIQLKTFVDQTEAIGRMLRSLERVVRNHRPR